MVLKEIDALKEHSRTQQKAEVVEPGDKISDLKTTAFRLCTRHSKHKKRWCRKSPRRNNPVEQK